MGLFDDFDDDIDIDNWIDTMEDEAREYRRKKKAADLFTVDGPDYFDDDFDSDEFDDDFI